jgi:hypothetical protein
MREAATTARGDFGWMAAALGGLALLVGGVVGLALGLEPFATWFYFFAWYGVLLAGDGVLARLGGPERDAPGEFLLLGRRAHLLTLLAWSAVVWFFFELLNFRLQNWYYVFLPDAHAVRWAGVVLAFATVLPAVFLAEALLRAAGVARTTRWRPVRVSERLLTNMRVAGWAMLALPLLWPRYFFPLVWLATTLLIEPSVYRRATERSLLADLARGEPGRILRLLLGGGIIGLLWELFNVGARAKWIYTVPWFDELKLFEMPVLGFFGFPPFAVECFVVWQALVLAGLAVPRLGASYAAPRLRRVGAVIFAAAFSVAVLAGMESRTVSSLSPSLHELPDVPASLLAGAGVSPFTLASAEPVHLAQRLGVEHAEAEAWIRSARIATLRGIGAHHATLLRRLGIDSVEALASADARVLSAALERLTGEDVVEARVRVWVRGARNATRSIRTSAAP